MNTKRWSLLGSLFACLFLSGVISSSAWAVPISGLFNTGVDASGNALAGGNGVTDPHYLVFSSTIGGVTTGVNAVTYFNSAYIANSATSRWISHSADGSPGNGTTTFRTTFDLTGLDPNSAEITGFNAADNGGSILLNGVNVGSLNGAFNTLAAFTISSGFIAGVNTLDFSVVDGGPPLALRIDGISGTADLAGPAAAPEPISAALLGLGLLGIAAVRRKQKRA